MSAAGAGAKSAFHWFLSQAYTSHGRLLLKPGIELQAAEDGFMAAWDEQENRIAALVAEREWRPIESAPKDDWVLVKTKIGDVITAHQQFGYWYAWIDYIGPELVIEDAIGWMPTPPTTGDDHG